MEKNVKLLTEPKKMKDLINYLSLTCSNIFSLSTLNITYS